jgi:hypothetical protein
MLAWKIPTTSAITGTSTVISRGPMNIFTRLLVALPLGLSLQAQPQGPFPPAPAGSAQFTATFSALPPWPATGVPSLERYPKGTYLFKDEATGDYIAYFPESLSPSLAHSKAFRTVRIPLPNKARATVAVRITRLPNGIFLYNYSVTNARESRHPMVRWSVEVAQEDEEVTMEHPSWKTSGESPAVLAARAGSGVGLAPIKKEPPLLRQPDRRRPLAWATTDRGSPLRPGAGGQGYLVRSSYRPGLTQAFFAGGPEVPIALSLPEPVMRQLDTLLSPEDTMSKNLTIGPVFAPDRTVLWRAADWHVGMQRLVWGGVVNAKSPFVVEVLQKLADLVQIEDQAVPLGERRQLPSFRIAARPATDFEQQLLTALVACFE